MRGIVWGYSTDSAKIKLKEIIQDYMLYWDIYPINIIETRHELKVQFTNGDYWRAFKVSSTNGRGLRCNISYIDNKINKDVINTIIQPCTISKPYRAIEYYYKNNEED